MTSTLNTAPRLIGWGVVAGLVSILLGSSESLEASPAMGLKPRVVTEPVRYDSDDPAIWINRAEPAKSLVLGTDKEADGALYVFGLDGKIRHELTIRGLLRPNNVDVVYDVPLAGRKVDIAVVAERFAHRVRVFSLPDMRPVDGGGIPVFEGERAEAIGDTTHHAKQKDDSDGT